MPIFLRWHNERCRLSGSNRTSLKCGCTITTGIYDRAETVIAEELPSTLLVHDGWLYTASRGTVRRYKQSRPGGPWDIRETIAQGFCGGLLIPLVFSAIFLMFPPPRRTRPTVVAGLMAMLAQHLHRLVGVSIRFRRSSKNNYPLDVRNVRHFAIQFRLEWGVFPTRFEPTTSAVSSQGRLE